MTFKEFNFEANLLEGLSSMGFDKPTPIQEQAIPIILKHQDLIACAQTGTGKTAAYLLPILNKISSIHTETIDTLIIAPTRELALQIDQALEGFAYFTSVGSIAVYGGGDGMSFEREKKALMQGANIIIATPGRLIAHLIMGYVKFDNLKHLVLDEADRMLDMGFNEDIVRIINYLPKKRQTLLFSATMPSKIRTLAKQILIHPQQINIALSKPAEGILQGAYLVYNNQKIELVKHLLKGKDLISVLIFSSTKNNVKIIEKELQKIGFPAKAIHSDLEQKEREAVLIDFRNKKTRILVATDILSRGIDIEGISLVINYDVPDDAEDYIHRVGRTARAETTGIALTFVNEYDQQKLLQIENLIEKEINKIPLPPNISKGPDYEPLKKVIPPKKRFSRPSSFSKHKR